MEFDDHHHRAEEEEEEEEEEASDEMMMGNDRNRSGGGGVGGGEVSNSLSRVRMAEAFSQVQIQPTPTMIVPPPPPAARPRYRECLKNHAVSVMGHAVDGCGEFMPRGPDGSLAALKCAACGCHRNFHRKEEFPVVYTHTPHLSHHQTTPPGAFASYYRTTPSGYLQLGAPRARPLALPPISGGNEDVPNPNGGGRASSDGKKRFRTKFTAEQKQQMLAMAERIGWRIQRGVEELVQQFCHEAAVKRHVFKVWMHNNKHTLGRTSSTNPNTTTTATNNNGGDSSRQHHQLMN